MALVDALWELRHYNDRPPGRDYPDVQCDGGGGTECWVRWEKTDPGCFMTISGDPRPRLMGRDFRVTGQAVRRVWLKDKWNYDGRKGGWGYDFEAPIDTLEAEVTGEDEAVAATYAFMKRCGVEIPRAEHEAAEEDAYLDFIWHEHPDEYAEAYKTTFGCEPDSLPGDDD